MVPKCGSPLVQSPKMSIVAARDDLAVRGRRDVVADAQQDRAARGDAAARDGAQHVLDEAHGAVVQQLEVLVERAQAGERHAGAHVVGVASVAVSVIVVAVTETIV